MRHASADPDRQPLHAAVPSDTAAQLRGLRHDAAADHGVPWVSDSGIELRYPSRLAWPSPWVGHIPFAMWLVEALRPRVFVELGVHSGNSYCAFLQAIQALSLPAQCYGIDHWRGDSHSDSYPEDVYTELRDYHDAAYGTFSTLLRSTFKDALAYFSDDTIDLLHIDGFHSFEAVSGDLADWLPKMSSRGVVLLHDINVRERDFGVWRVWEDLTARYDTFAFAHSHGLGVAYVGSDPPPPALRALLALKDADSISQVRTYFARLGTSLVDRFERRQAEVRAGRLPAVEAALEATRADGRRHAETAESLRAELDTSVARVVALEGELNANRAALDGELNASRAEVARQRESIVSLQQELMTSRADIDTSAVRVGALEGELHASRGEVARQSESMVSLQQDLMTARADMARHVDLAVAGQRERVVLRAEAARRVDEAERLRREIAALRTDIARHHESTAAAEQELGAARAETARHAETAAALQRELDAARTETARRLAAVDTARAAADTVSQRVAALEEELTRTRGQVSAALAQRERATLLLREHLATTAALRREMTELRNKT